MMLDRTATTWMQRARVLVVALVLALSAMPLLAAAIAAQDASPAPDADASPTAEQAACASAEDLQVIVDYLRDSLESDAGLVPVGIGTIAALSEARTLANLVAEVYRPLVEDLIVSLQDLRDTLGELDELDTAGSKLATIGESVTEIGLAMDAIAVQLRTPCPSDDTEEGDSEG